MPEVGGADEVKDTHGQAVCAVMKRYDRCRGGNCNGDGGRYEAYQADERYPGFSDIDVVQRYRQTLQSFGQDCRMRKEA